MDADCCIERGQVRELLRDVVQVIWSKRELIDRERYNLAIKADGSPVTSADIYIEGLIKSYLIDRLPGLVLFGEESFTGDVATLPAGYHAILDPIDGTENFCSGLKEWGIALTLWHGPNHLGSLLYMPELGEHLMTGDKLKPVRSRIRGFSSSMCDEILEGMASTRESRLMGCAVYNLYNVIRGSFARFTNPRGAHAWDLLPGLMLALEHKCDVEVEGKPYHGEFLEPGRKYRVDIRHRYDLHPG